MATMNGGPKSQFRENDIRVSVNLVDASRKQLQFLREVDHLGFLYGGPIVINAIRRYEQFWLPLMAENSSQVLELSAPIDIQWVWHVHMLAPYYYEKDCTTLVGKVIDHRVMWDKDRKIGMDAARRLWVEKYPTEPFEVGLVLDSHSKRSMGNGDVRHEDKPLPNGGCIYESKISYKLKDAIQRQSLFYYQVSLPHYFDKRFLETAQLRYKKYLFLKRCNPDLFLVPCYDFDLIWHSHQLHPLLYKTDTTSILGKMFNHDDSVNDRSKESKLIASDIQTRELWKKTFDEDFALCGAMYRGNPPRGKLHTVSNDALYKMSTKIADVLITSVGVLNMEEDESNFSLKVGSRQTHNGHSTYSGQPILKLKGPARQWQNDKGLIKFSFDTGRQSSLIFELSRKKGLGCFSSQQFVGSHLYPFVSEVESTPNGGQELMRTLPLHNGDTKQPLEVSVPFKASITQPIRGPCIFNLNMGSFETATIPENIESMWGPVPLQRLPEGMENTCIVASHQLLNHAHELQFTCRIIHSIPLMMSSVQVYHRDKMVAVSHLISTDQIPLSAQVKTPEACLTIEPSVGERALLIKDNLGDWGVAVGKWEGVRRGVPGKAGKPGAPGSKPVRGVPGIPGDPGHLVVSFLNLRTHQWSVCQAPNPSGQFRFIMQHMLVDLSKGTISVKPETENIGQCLCLAFSVAVLQVLCQPRPPHNLTNLVPPSLQH